MEGVCFKRIIFVPWLQSSGVMQLGHKAHKEFNLKIDLEIAAEINRHKV